jgi:hypothetical protein
MSESLDISLLHAECLGTYRGTLNFVFSEFCTMTDKEKLQLILDNHRDMDDKMKKHYGE